MSDSACPQRIAYLSQLTKGGDLEQLRIQALKDIGEALNSQLYIAHADREYRHNRAGVYIPIETRIVEYKYHVYNMIYPGTRGHYNKPTGKIILQEGKWCIQTIIHESLHSVSILSNEEYVQEGDRIQSFKESLTEFLTGLVLFRKYNDSCFHSWKIGNYDQWCNVSYKSGVQTLCALGKWISSREFVELYLWKPSDRWTDHWHRFSNAIKQVFPTFEDNYETWKQYDFMTEFGNELVNKLGREFRRMRNLFNYSFVLP